MKISKKSKKKVEIETFNKKAKEVMENTEAIINNIINQGEIYNKSQIGDCVSYTMDNGLEVNKNSEMTWIGNSSHKIAHYQKNEYPYFHREEIYSGIFLKVMDKMGFHTVSLEGCKNNRIFFQAKITRDYEGNYVLDSGAMNSVLDINDWSLFDIAKRSIKETDDIDGKMKLGKLASKEKKIEILERFKKRLGVEEQKISGDNKTWIIDTLIDYAIKCGFSQKDWAKLRDRCNEIIQQNNQQSSGQVEEEGR